MSTYGRPPSSSAANRPSSRAGTSWGRGASNAPIGLGGNPAMPPKTGIAVPGTTGVLLPPSTASRRPGTSMRTAMGSDRPGTQQGVGGMPKTSYQGSGRVVQDRSYWMGELKQRLGALGTELGKIHNDMDSLEHENAGFVTMEKRAQGLGDELRDLQGQLGDYNMLLDKLHSDADLEEVQRQAAVLVIKNDADQQAVDGLFMERQDKEQKIKELELQIKTEKDRAADRIAQLEPTSHSAWMQFEAQSSTLLASISQQQSKLTAAQIKRTYLEDQVKLDPVRQQMWALQEKRAFFQAKLRDLTGNGSGPGAAPTDLDSKEAILDDIKRSNTEIANMERTLADLTKEHNRLAAELQAATTAASDDKAAKYEELVKKDAEMQAFLDAFPEQHGNIVGQLTTAQNESAVLLEEIRSLAAPPAGTPSDLRRMAGDLKDKEKELATAESTFVAVQAERERMLGDLQRIDQLDTKIVGELAAAQARVAALTADLAKFDRVDEISKSVVAQRDEAAAQVAGLQQQRTWAKMAVTLVATRVDIKRAQLAENDTARQLVALESKWRAAESSVSAMRQQVAERAAEADYASSRTELTALVHECLLQNQKLAKQVAI
ncbi:hypothetical protein BC828DRAFT_373926 [Blastocladiella britannica]|nr:hypothetical protein BC828DRAFT_373926 [Blastocladiella britannica]